MAGNIPTPANRLPGLRRLGPSVIRMRWIDTHAIKLAARVTDLLDSAHLRRSPWEPSSPECVKPCPKKRRFPASLFLSACFMCKEVSHGSAHSLFWAGHP